MDKFLDENYYDFIQKKLEDNVEANIKSNAFISRKRGVETAHNYEKPQQSQED